MKFQVIILDEVHRAASRTSKIHRAIKQLKVEYKIGLSGSPLMNKITDIWGIYDVLITGYLGRWWSFLDRYTNRNYWGAVTSVKNLWELKARLAPVMIRKTVEEVKLELPSVSYTTLTVTLSVNERKLYDKIKKELLFELEHDEVSKLSSPMILQNSLVKMGKLLEICDSLELLGESTVSQKLQTLRDHLADIVLSKKAIIFTRFSRMAYILERELMNYHPAIITGEHSIEWRQDAIRRFNEDPDCRILIGTEAASQGLNLQTASVVYNYDLPWSVGKLIQRTGRAARIGQAQPVLVVNLVCERTVEAHVLKLLSRKISLARDLLDDEHVFTSLDAVKEALRG